MELKELQYDAGIRDVFRVHGIKSIDDITNLTLDDLKRITNYHFQVVKVRRILHDNGLYLKDEYKDLDITLEEANIKLEDLADLNKHIKVALTRQLGIRTLGELLTTDYDEILKTKNIGEYYMEMLKEYIHKKGYVLKNEEVVLREILIQKRKEGLQLLEDVIELPRIYFILYRNGIYTIEDLVNYGPKVLELSGLGPLKQKQLISKMKELGVEFRVDSILKKEINHGTLIEEVKRENKEIVDRIEHKASLIDEVDELIKERDQLLAREKELDELIDRKLKELGGSAYVKKEGIR